jgi:hypothetical protein
MTVPELYFFILFIVVLLVVPIGTAIRTLLAMKEKVIVPLLRGRTTAGDVSYSVGATSFRPAQFPHSRRAL